MLSSSIDNWSLYLLRICYQYSRGWALDWPSYDWLSCLVLEKSEHPSKVKIPIPCILCCNNLIIPHLFIYLYQLFYSTALCRIGCQEARSKNAVKTVVDSNGCIMYCSRLPIPFNGYTDINGETFYLQHIGIYGYQRDILKAYAKMPSTRLQQSEDLEQLKLLENGFRLYSVTVESHSPGVDTLYDVRCVEDLIISRQKKSGDVRWTRMQTAAEPLHPVLPQNIFLHGRRFEKLFRTEN